MSIALPFSRRVAALAVAGLAVAPVGASAVTLDRTTTASRRVSTGVTAQVAVRARARWCDGAPRMRVQLDRTRAATRLVRSPFAETYRFAAAARPGTHTVRVTFVNRHRGRGCRRALRVDAVRLEPLGAPASEPLAPAAAALTPEPVVAVPAPVSLPARPTAAPAPPALAPPSPPGVAEPSAAAEPAPADANPLAGQKLFVPATPVASVAPASIAEQPQATWFGDFSGDVRAAVAAKVGAAATAGALPILVAYDIPHRDCGGYSSGGADSPTAYRAWIRAFAAGIAGRPAIVILEPDALASLDCLPAAERAPRFDLIADAVDVLAAQPGAVTYVDIGHSHWLPPDQAAGRLARANVAHARGFALNVSNFDWSSAENAYGREVAGRLAGKGFVVDTSRNGRGPAPGAEWCNPAGRGLGAPPAVAPGGGPDANLWIKRPGESDGTCNGGPAAGVFWPTYAIGLAQRAAGAG